MSLRRNLVASYASQIYVTLIGIVMVPAYLGYMGAEAYGLVGFFAMLQAWFLILDLGLSPTLTRETARFAGGAIDGLTLRRLLRILEAVFIAVALAGGLSLALGADWVAAHWLKVEHLPAGQVRVAIILMAGIVALRWVAGLYRGAVAGFERQVWLGWLHFGTATARFVGVLPIFIFVGTTPAHFFTYQLLVALVETGTVIWMTYRLLPAVSAGTRIGFDWRPLKHVLRFSMTIAFTGAVWVGVTQSDKLLLSRLLSLSDYGYYTLAVLAASGVSILSGPLSSALLPRLSRLHAARDAEGLTRLYRQATQIMAVIACPLALALALCAEPLLQAWTGNAALAAQAAPVLSLYALGNGVLALAAFPYYLQFAHGDVRLHLIGNVFFVLILIPAIWVATTYYGALGAGWAWLGSNVIYALVWIPVVHHRLLPGLHWRWMLQDVGAIALPVGVCGLLMVRWLTWPSDRVASLALLTCFGLALLALAAISSSQVRGLLRGRLAPVARA